VTSDWLVVDELAPSTSGVLAPLFAAASRGELALPFCSSCGEPMELEQIACDRCADGVPSWHPVEPAGTVHSVTTVHRLEPGLVRTAEPYPVVDVELESRHRVIMTTQHQVAAAPTIGAAVRIAFRSIDGVSVPAVACDPPSRSDREVSP
jgi:uncharacterized OB-fold protein